MVSALIDHLDHFQRRVVQDALSEASADYWRRRAEMLRWAQPRPGEFNGRAPIVELRARWQRLEEEAKACEARASVALLGGDKW